MVREWIFDHPFRIDAVLGEGEPEVQRKIIAEYIDDILVSM